MIRKILALRWVSIHTPIQGVTRDPAENGWNHRSFNPHTHTGCDHKSPFSGGNRLFQSTHPYRVWQNSTSTCSGTASFNPHTHTGCDSDSPTAISSTACFNPHTHTGCDYSRLVDTLSLCVSIHTPIQGVTCKTDATDFVIPVSIHTPIQGVTYQDVMDDWLEEFQSTHPYRVWPYDRDTYG